MKQFITALYLKCLAVVVQLSSYVQVFVTLWSAARQHCLSHLRSLPRFMSTAL